MSSLNVHMYTSPENAFFVNSYWIETELGNIVIDTQFLISQARQVRSEIEKTGKPILAVIVTHPHPDHYNGAGTLLEGLEQIPVYATMPTLEGIRATEGPKRAEWTPTYGSDYPESIMLPNQIVKSGQSVTIDGIELHFQDIGAAETSNHTLISLPREQALFCGDLVYNRVHSWLVEGHSSLWLQRLGQVLNEYKVMKSVYPGHGQPTTLLGLNEQISYINLVQSLIRKALEQSNTLTDTDKAAIKATIEAQYAHLPLASLYNANIEGITQELEQSSQSRGTASS